MQTTLKTLGLIFFLLGASCKPSINMQSIYLIRIDAFETKAENVEFAATLFSYDPAYVMSHIESYDPEKMAGAIQLGYHIPPGDDTNPTYRYTLNMANKSVRKNADQLKSDFDTFIPQLMETHLSKENLFEELTDPAEDWLTLLLEGEFAIAYEQSGSQVKKTLTLEKFTEVVDSLRGQMGDLKSSRFLRGQFYENFQGQSRLVNVVFEQKFSNDITWTNSVMMGEEDGNWVAQGFYSLPNSLSSILQNDLSE